MFGFVWGLGSLVAMLALLEDMMRKWIFSGAIPSPKPQMGDPPGPML